MLSCVISLIRFNDTKNKSCENPKNQNEKNKCAPSKWYLKNIPNGKYKVTIGVRDDHGETMVSLVANGVNIYNA